MDIPSAACVEQRPQGSNKLQRKGFSAALTRTQTKKNHGAALRENTEVKATEIRNTADGTDPHPRFRYLQRRTESNAGRKPGGLVIKNLVEVRKFSSPSRLSLAGCGKFLRSGWTEKVKTQDK